MDLGGIRHGLRAVASQQEDEAHVHAEHLHGRGQILCTCGLLGLKWLVEKESKSLLKAAVALTPAAIKLKRLPARQGCLRAQVSQAMRRQVRHLEMHRNAMLSYCFHMFSSAKWPNGLL